MTLDVITLVIRVIENNTLLEVFGYNLAIDMNELGIYIHILCNVLNDLL